MQRRFELVDNRETGAEGGQTGPPWGDGLVLQVRARDVDGGANDNVANDCMMKIMGKLQSVFSTVPPDFQCQNKNECTKALRRMNKFHHVGFENGE